MSEATTPTIVSISNNTYANGSSCRIMSLEVYRGMTEIIEINSSGFLLNKNATFEVKKL